MTITIGIKNYYDDYTYTLNNNPIRQEKVTIHDYPEHSGELALKISKDDMEYITGTLYTTQKISPTVTLITGTASSISALASYIEGDANVTSERLIFNGKEVNGSTFYRNGLRPNYNYIAEYTITVDNHYSYTKKVNLRTEALNFVNAAPKVISEGNVIISSTSNLDEAETDVGFEWRRTDWTNDFQSNIAGAYLFEGTQEGYIRNMNTNYLWKFRPYYRSADGAYFYGSWLGIDPTNTSYFEPTVHTYSSITVKGNSAQIKGYVMRGSDDITQQGFIYWKGSTRAGGNDVPETATMIEAKGTVMNANLRELDYETTYHYVAFVKTAEGETYYGEEKSFTTEIDTGMGLIEDPESDVKEEGVYDLSGRRINNMQEGIYIIRYTDGSSRKVFIN
ncbi:MAG: hypothetical protein J6T94_00405 [Bacteroidaceae bacterium]|nr:hypothetical protein [Bacteroidaceae bacterium]